MESPADGDNTHSDIPTLYSDEEGKHPITWDRNLASIVGTLAAVGRAIRTQQPRIYRLIVTRTVEERGLTFIDSTANIDFLDHFSPFPTLNPAFAGGRLVAD